MSSNCRPPVFFAGGPSSLPGGSPSLLEDELMLFRLIDLQQDNGAMLPASSTSPFGLSLRDAGSNSMLLNLG